MLTQTWKFLLCKSKTIIWIVGAGNSRIMNLKKRPLLQTFLPAVMSSKKQYTWCIAERYLRKLTYPYGMAREAIQMRNYKNGELPQIFLSIYSPGCTWNVGGVCLLILAGYFYGLCLCWQILTKRKICHCLQLLFLKLCLAWWMLVLKELIFMLTRNVWPSFVINWDYRAVTFLLMLTNMLVRGKN